MTTRTARRPGALVPVALDNRPCVINDPRWWDVGNDGNAAAMWLCRTRCPMYGDEEACEITPSTIRHGIAYGSGDYYGNNPKPLKSCQDCGHPKVRKAVRGPATCKCPDSGRTREEVIQAWLAAGGQTRPMSDIAPEIGVGYHALRDTIRRARKSGDRRVPLLPSTTTEQVAA